MQVPIVDALEITGLQEDCPFSLEEDAEPLTAESAAEVSDNVFKDYAGRLNEYLQVGGFISTTAGRICRGPS